MCSSSEVQDALQVRDLRPNLLMFTTASFIPTHVFLGERKREYAPHGWQGYLAGREFRYGSLAALLPCRLQLPILSSWLDRAQAWRHCAL